MSVPVTRIFSDLHFRDGESRLHDLRAFAPLLAGADRIVLNGDTLDSHADADGSDLAGIRAFFAQHAPQTTFLSGNHDPDISPHGELLLNDGRVWITHGDVLFDDIAPWSSLRAEMAGRLELLFAAVPPEERALLETRLRLHRLACRGLPEHHDRLDRTVFTRASRLAHILFPPHRLLTMLRVWRTTPALARQLARAQRPRARLVVLGHTHYPGVWSGRDGPVVVNTGSFCRPFGHLYVELRGDRVQVVRIAGRRGCFHPGRVVAGFSLAP